MPAAAHEYELRKRELVVWDDPRLPTLRGIRRRGYTPEALRSFCERIGVSKFNGTIDMAWLEDALRADLNKKTNRILAVLRPLKIVIDNYPEGQVEDIKFRGLGCAISQASTSLMTMKLKGKSAADARWLLAAFHDLVTTEVPEPPRMLGDLRLLSGVKKFPQRVKCAMLGWRAFEQALQQRSGEASVSTEPA